MNDAIAGVLRDNGLFPDHPLLDQFEPQEALLLLIYQELSGISFGGPGSDTVNVTQNYNGSREVIDPSQTIVLGNERWETGKVSDLSIDADLTPATPKRWSRRSARSRSGSCSSGRSERPSTPRTSMATETTSR